MSDTPAPPVSNDTPAPPAPDAAPAPGEAAEHELERTPGGGMIRFAIRRPVTVTVGVILVILFGVLSVLGLPIQLTPDVSSPTLTVTTVWPGASPAEIENDIVEKQEEVLKGLPGMLRMTSQTRRGQGTVTLELEVGSSMDEALVRVTNFLSRVADYPENAEQPVLTTSDSSGPPLAVMVIQAADLGEVAEYRTWVEDEIVPRLDRVRGVAEVRLIGGRDTEIQVDFDPNALAARRLTVADIARAVRGQLADVSGGDIPMGKRRYVFRTELAPDDPSDLEQIVLTTRADGTPVLLGDVAKVRAGLRKREAVGMVNGKPSMALLLFREAGYNVLEVTREIRAVVDELQERWLAPEGLDIRIVSDQVDYIEGALELVSDNLLLGGLLAMAVLFLFLRSIGASLVVAMSIPISVIGTALGMSLLGRTINIVSLAGMAFAVGMVVDNSIVVLENIDTWRARTKSVARAAFLGAREVWGAIFASTVTTAAVFIPIISWQDEVGELLRDVAVALAVSVFVSLVVSVLVIPSFAAKLLRGRRAPPSDEELSFDAPGIRAAVGRWVRALVARPVVAAVVGVVGVGAIGWLGLSLVPPLEYLPSGNRNFVFGVVLPPPGYSVDETEALGLQISSVLVPHTGVEKDGRPALERSFFVGNPDSAFMGAVGEDPERIDEVAALVREAQQTLPDVFAFAAKASLFGRNLGGSRSIEVDIVGRDLAVTLAFAGRLFGELRRAIPGAQIRPVPGLDAGAPEFSVTPRRAQAQALGISPTDLGLVVSAYVDGAIIGEVGRDGEPKRNVVLRATGVTIDSPESLRAAPVATPSGRVAPLDELASFVETLGPSVIQHIERRRAITLAVTPPDEIPLETAIATIRDDVVGPLIASDQVPEGLSIEYSGSAGKLEEATGRFATVLLLAVLISYLLLSALFEDFLAPIAILVTVPLAGAGGVLGLLLVDATLGAQPLDMMTAIGFIILIGVVVNNAILVVDGALMRMRAGASLSDSLGDSVRGRVRPIFMSALTSLAGLLPLVLFPGAGSELYRGVGAIVLGGLAMSTVLTVFLVPAVFATLWRLRGVR